MQPLDDINPDILNYGPGMGALELIGAITVCIIVGVLFQWIISDDDDYRKYY